MDRIDAPIGAVMMLIDPPNINFIANPSSHIWRGALPVILVPWIGGIGPALISRLTGFFLPRKSNGIDFGVMDLGVIFYFVAVETT